MTNVLIGKFGKHISFDPSKWGMVGGDSESAILISCMAQCYPNVNFYIASRNDFDKINSHIRNAINKNSNVFNIWERYDSQVDNQSWIEKYVESNNIKLDFGLFYGGPSSGCTIPDSMYLITEPDKTATPMSSSKRSVGIITKFLNDSRLPYVEIGEDPRYLPVQAKDLFNRSKKILCVKEDMTFSIEHIKNYLSRKIIETEIPCSDVGHSYMFLMNEDKNDLLKEPGDRKTRINVAMHCTASQDGSVDKWNLVKNFILDPFPETFIYGKWDEKIIAGKHQNQFKEIPMTDLHDVMYDTQYTLAIGGSKTWGTQSKFWKMLMFGIIPFLDPDNENIFGAPEFIETDSAEDFIKKISFLENNHDEYVKLWHKCQELIQDDDLWNGSRFFNNLEREISDIFGIQLERGGVIDYKSSSIFLNRNESDLLNFFK
mgnify:FL=1|tara:strand:- start:58 stop:1347 length:1290 start_codon:yes stop_codon:yes gene_type:complete